MNGTSALTYNPGSFLGARSPPNTTHAPAVLLILNQPIARFDVFAQLWLASEYRICADGGANRVYDLFSRAGLEPQRDDYLPDAIHGDLDSLRGDVREYYASRGVAVTRDPDQQSTDFQKVMQKIDSTHPEPLRHEILILGGLGGRVDQGLGLVHEMIREERRNALHRLWLVSEASVSFVLKQGRNSIEDVRASSLFTNCVGLIPVYGPATITTEGLKWDVADWDTQMGTRVSTSNQIVADEVHVHTSAPLLFTVEMNPWPRGVQKTVNGASSVAGE